MDLTALLLSRIQFGSTVAFHIIFPSFTIGLAAWLTVLEALHLWTGRPVRRDQTTVVSRWSLMPTAASARASAPASCNATRMQVRTRSRISSASCSTQPGRGVIWACSSWWLATGCPVRSKRMQRLLVVPWSMAATSDRRSIN